MNVIRNKIKLLDRQTGTTSVFLTGLTTKTTENLEKVLRKYIDSEARYDFVVEPYVATVYDEPKPERQKSTKYQDASQQISTSPAYIKTGGMR